MSLSTNRQINPKVSYDAIDVMRLICSFLVVVIHCKPFLPYSQTLNTFTAEGFCRIAVPFFFVVSGTFLYKKILSSDCKNVWERLRICFHQSSKIIILYLVWSVVYIALNMVLTQPWGWGFFADQIRLLFCDASYYHFWYLPALIYGQFLFGFFCCLKRKGLFGLITVGWLCQCLKYSYRWIPFGGIIPWTTDLFNAAMNTVFCAVPMLSLSIICCQDYKKKTLKAWLNQTLLWFAINQIELAALYFWSPNKLHFEFLLSMPMLIYNLINLLLNLRFSFRNRRIPVYLRSMSRWVYCIHPLMITVFGCFHTSEGIRRFIVVIMCVIVTGILYVAVQSRRMRR